MNPKQLVKLSNIIGVISIIALVYWVFTFITIEVFGLKVFRENMTQSFYMSILGILALMFGALMINIMFNLTRIAQKHNNDNIQFKKKFNIGWVIAIGFPLILGILFGGDYLTSQKKKRHLIESAQYIAKNISKSKITDYSFTEKWIINTADLIDVLSETDKYFPNIHIVTSDSVDNIPAFLIFRKYYSGTLNDTISPKKKNYILSTNKEEKDYLNSVFNGNNSNHRFSSHDGKYELYFPVKDKNGTIVIYFSQHRRYGKIGS